MILRKMATRIFTFISLAALLSGCGKSNTEAGAPKTAPASPPAMNAVARIHWLGMKNISVDRNAIGLMQVWNLPEGTNLERQTLSRLCEAPWRFLRGQTNPASTNLLQPLLQDLVDEESYVEIDQPSDATNRSGEMVLAIRLNEQRAAAWQTNVAEALESLTGIRPTNSSTPGGWVLHKHHAPNLIECSRAGEWVVLGAGWDHNALMEKTLARISQEHRPFPAPSQTSWLEADFSPSRVATALGIAGNFPTNLPNVFLVLRGESQNVRMHAELTFPKPLELDLQRWQVPTNLIGEPLLSFMAVRGIQSRLASLPAWNNLQIGPPPNQLYVWSTPGFPVNTFMAAPMADASNRVSQISDFVLKNQQSWFSTNHRLAVFQRSRSFNGLEWAGAPYVKPFLQSTSDGSGQFAFGGFFRPAVSTANAPLSADLLSGLFARTNLVLYDREHTDSRVQEWLYIGQFIRLIVERPQLPSDSAGLKWLKASDGKILGDSLTEVTQLAPDRLAIDRSSDVGLTGIELQVLADWLESSDFPLSLHSLQSSKPPPPP